MDRFRAPSVATELLIDWVFADPLAVRELAGAAIAYGGATDQSYEASARRIASCVLTLVAAPTDDLKPPALTQTELADVDWIRVLRAVVDAAATFAGLAVDRKP